MRILSGFSFFFSSFLEVPFLGIFVRALRRPTEWIPPDRLGPPDLGLGLPDRQKMNDTGRTIYKISNNVNRSAAYRQIMLQPCQ